MTTLHQWAKDWGIPPDAVNDLIRRMTTATTRDSSTASTEAGASQRVRLQYAEAGHVMWRNNVGVFMNEQGVPVRCGIANESKQMNKKIKSSDLIGIQQVLITHEMVGGIMGQFVAREVKEPGWRYMATDREQAQLAFIELVLSKGGDAAFTTG